MFFFPEGAIEGFIAAVVLVPSLAAAPLLPWIWQQHRKRSSAVWQDACCLELASRLGTAIHFLQIERGQTVARLSGGDAPDLRLLQQNSDNALTAIHRFIGLPGGGAVFFAGSNDIAGASLFSPGSRLARMYDDCCCKLERALARRNDQQVMASVFMQDYSTAIAALLAFTAALVSQSQRGVAADLGQAWINLLAAGEYAARERGLMNAVLSSGHFSGVPRQLQDLIDEQEVFLSQALLCGDSSILALLQEHCPPTPALLQMRAALLNSEQVIPVIDPADWFATSSRRIDAMKSVGESLAIRMRASLQISGAGTDNTPRGKPLLRSAVAGTALALLALLAWSGARPATAILSGDRLFSSETLQTAAPPPAQAFHESGSSRDSSLLRTAATHH